MCLNELTCAISRLCAGEPEQIKDTASLAQHLEKQNREHRALQEQRAKIHQLTTGLPPVTDPAAAETMGHPHPTVQEQRTKQVKFTDLDARQYDAAARRQRVVGSTGSSISDLSVFHWDKSQFLEMLLQVAYEGRWEELLGELQLAFLLFLNLYSFPALNQWKKFVDLLCRAEGAVAQRPDLFVAFIRILHTQLNAVPSDFFENELSKHNFLAPAFSSLFQVSGRPTASAFLCAHHADRGVLLPGTVAQRFGRHVAGESSPIPQICAE